MSETTTQAPETAIDVPGFVLTRDEATITAHVTPGELVELSDAELAHTPDGSLMSRDVGVCADAIKRRPELWGAFGLKLEATEGTQTVVTPSNPVLNELRAAVPAEVGLSTATFVDTPTPDPEEDGGWFGAEQFLTMIAKGQIPMAVVDPQITHDNFSHRPGYTAMCDQIFKRLQKAAQVALDSKDPEAMNAVTSAIDEISSDPSPTIVTRFSGLLEVEYRKFMNPVMAAIRARQDERAQKRTAQKLLAYTGQKK